MKNPLVPMKAAITGVRVETRDVKTYAVEADPDAFMGFSPGQFNMLGLPGVGEAAVSLSSTVAGGCFEHTIRSLGRVTQYLEGLGKGDEIFLRGPYGRGWPLDGAMGGDLLIAAGGLGLAPLRPVLQTVLGDRDAFGNVALVYGARDPMSVIYRDELDKWRKHVGVFLAVDEVPEGVEWPYATGLVTDLLEKAAVGTPTATAFVCGPELMMRLVSRRLLQLGLSPSRLYVSLERRMRCAVGQCGHCQHGSAFVCRDGPVFLYRDVQRSPDGLL